MLNAGGPVLFEPKLARPFGALTSQLAAQLWVLGERRCRQAARAGPRPVGTLCPNVQVSSFVGQV